MSEIKYMQMHHYLDELLGSKAMLRLIRSLVTYDGRVFTVRKLAQASGVSPAEAALAVKQLEKFGILTVQPVGRSYLISVNNDSYFLSRILRPALKAEESTVRELVGLLRRHLGDRAIMSAAIFGSMATASRREDSDIDLLVVSDDFDAAAGLVAKAGEQVSLVFNGRLSPLIMSKKELAAKKDKPLLRSILGGYIHVAGRDLSQVIAG